MSLNKVEIITSKTHMGLRKLVATSKVPAGTVILTEKPVACVPFESSSMSGLLPDEGSGRYLLHEIQMKAAAKLRSFNGYTCLLASRLLLSMGDLSSDLKSEYAKLCCHFECFDEDQYCGMSECAAILQGMLSIADPSTVISFDTCNETIGKLCFNAFTICDDYMVDAGIGLFLKASSVNHSCDPNAVQFFDDNAVLSIRTIKDIDISEEVLISYIDTGTPTWYRRCELMKKYNFSCNCPRCLACDPREGFRCQSKTDCSGLCYVVNKTSPKTLYTNWLEASSGVLTEGGLMGCTFRSTADMVRDGDNQTAEKVPIKSGYWHDLLLAPIPYGDVLGRHIQQTKLTQDGLTFMCHIFSIKCSTCGKDICESQEGANKFFNRLIRLVGEYSKLHSKYRDMDTGLKESSNGSNSALRSSYFQLLVNFNHIQDLVGLLLPEDSFCAVDIRSKIKASLELDAKSDIHTLVPTSSSVLLFTDKIEHQYIINFQKLLNSIQKCYPIRHPRKTVEKLQFIYHVVSACEMQFALHTGAASASMPSEPVTVLPVEVVAYAMGLINTTQREVGLLYPPGHTFHHNLSFLQHSGQMLREQIARL